MALTKKLLIIDVNEDIPDIVVAKQEDANTRFLDVRLFDGGVPVNLNRHTVRFSSVKPDGYRIYNNCEVTDGENGRFQVELTNQTLAVMGKVEAEFTLYGDNEKQVLTTRTFHIIVLKNLFDEKAVESTNEFGAAAILFQDVAAMREIIWQMNKLLLDNLDVKVSSRASQVSVDALSVVVNKISNQIETNLLPGTRILIPSNTVRVTVPNRTTVDPSTNNWRSTIWLHEFIAPHDGVITISGEVRLTAIITIPPDLEYQAWVNCTLCLRVYRIGYLDMLCTWSDDMPPPLGIPTTKLQEQSIPGGFVSCTVSNGVLAMATPTPPTVEKAGTQKLQVNRNDRIYIIMERGITTQNGLPTTISEQVCRNIKICYDEVTV